MDAFAQGARKARAAEALLRDETSTARAVRRERFHSAALILTFNLQRMNCLAGVFDYRITSDVGPPGFLVDLGIYDV